MRGLAPLAWVLAAGLLVGCASTPPTGPTAPTAPATEEFRSLSQLPATGSVDGADLAPGPEASTKETWVAVSGLLAPDDFQIATEAGEGTLLKTRTADLETAHWSLEENGSVVLHTVDSHPDKTSSLFDPPLLVAPASLAAGESVTATSNMRAVYSAPPNRERDRGTATRTVRYERDEEIAWRGATHRAKVIRVTFTGTFGAATAERTSELWVIPGEGVVAKRWNETLTVLKVFPKRSEQFSHRR